MLAFHKALIYYTRDFRVYDGTRDQPMPGYHLMSTSLFGWLPSLENRNGQAINQNNPAATTLKRRLQCKRSSTQSSSKISSLDIFCLFSSFSLTIEHSFTERGRKGAVLHSELANNYTRPIALRNHSELQNGTAGTPLAVQNPFLLPVMSQTCLAVLLVLAILESF